MVLLDLQLYMHGLQIVVCPLVLFPLASVLSVLLRFMGIDFLFGIFKLFFIRNNDCLHFASTSVHPCFHQWDPLFICLVFGAMLRFLFFFVFFSVLIFIFDLFLFFVVCVLFVLVIVFALFLVLNVTHLSGQIFLDCLFVFSLRFMYVVK